MLLIFSGRRWVVQEIHDREKVIVVKPAMAGVPPVFGGDAGDIHDKVIDRMFAVLEGDFSPAYIDTVSLTMLEEARAHYEQLGFRANNIHSIGEHTSIIATRVGTVKTSTLALALRGEGLSVEQHDGFLLVEAGDETPDLQTVLTHIRSGEPVDLFAGAGNFMSEKFHPYLSKPLLELDAASSKLVPQILPTLVERIIQA
jgi:ATP-dependent Lhr-like helicase